MRRGWAVSLLCSAMLLHLLPVASAAAQPSPEWIRVAVVRGEPEVSLQIHGPFTMHALDTGTQIRQGAQLPPQTLRGTPTGLLLGGTLLPGTGIRVQTEPSADIGLNGRHLRGTIEIVRQKNLALLVINYVSLEDYLRGVLSKEAPDYWPSEALKTIAIVARTYALYQRLTKAELEYDVTGDVMSQDYGGKTSEKMATSLAVEQTRGLVLTYRGQIFPTFYHSTCGGKTENARAMGDYDIKPLSGGLVCQFCSASPFYVWRRRVTHADVGWALRKSAYGSVGTVQDLQVTKRTSSSRVEQVEIVGSQRTIRLSGYDFRSLLGFDRIRSPLFTVQDAGDAFVLDGHGWGHGVGLCQWGAAELARRGVLAPEILSFYYPGAELAQLSDLPTPLVSTPVKNPQ